MRPIKEITAKEENFRLEQVPGACFKSIKRDGVKPEPEGTIVLMAFRIIGYDPDCDGSLMVRLEQIDKEGKTTGYAPTNLGLYSSADLVVSLEEWQKMFESN